MCLWTSSGLRHPSQFECARSKVFICSISAFIRITVSLRMAFCTDFSCESLCICSVFSFLLIRHFAAATLFFSREFFRLSASAASIGSDMLRVALRDALRLREGLVFVGDGVNSLK